MSFIDELFSTLNVTAEVFHNGQYCGNWAVDTSGSHYITFHVVSRGKCWLKARHSELDITQLNAGDMVIFPTDSQHTLSSDAAFAPAVNQQSSSSFDLPGDANATGLVCGFFRHQHPLIHQLTAHLPATIVIRKAELAQQTLHRLLDIILQESTDQQAGSKLALARLAEALLVLLFRQHITADKGLIAASVHPKLGPSLTALHREPAQKWTVEMLAQFSHMSRAAYSQLFKEVLGQSPMDYVAQWRLGHGYNMLSRDHASVLEAALACGYDNESSFSKAFKRVMGISPGAVRQPAD